MLQTNLVRYWTVEWELLLRRYTILGTVVAFNIYISQRLNAPDWFITC